MSERKQTVHLRKRGDGAQPLRMLLSDHAGWASRMALHARGPGTLGVAPLKRSHGARWGHLELLGGSRWRAAKRFAVRSRDKPVEESVDPSEVHAGRTRLRATPYESRGVAAGA